jgi:hypothetical protein
MFGLTRREQRWKAEQKAAEALVPFAVAAVQAAAQVRAAEAQTDAAELARLRAAEADFHMEYRLKCDVENKAQAQELERLRAVLLVLANAADAVGVAHFDSDDLPPAVQALQNATTAARMALRPNVRAKWAPAPGCDGD